MVFQKSCFFYWFYQNSVFTCECQFLGTLDTMCLSLLKLFLSSLLKKKILYFKNEIKSMHHLESFSHTWHKQQSEIPPKVSKSNILINYDLYLEVVLAAVKPIKEVCCFRIRPMNAFLSLNSQENKYNLICFFCIWRNCLQ